MEQCSLGVQIQPVETSFGLPPICTQRLTAMELFIYGRSCDDSTACLGNEESCTDFNGGPAGYGFSEIYARVYGQGEVGSWLHNGPVDENTGSIWLRRADGARLPADMVVELYQNVPNPFAFPLQIVTFHSSCSQPLICFNNFGSATILSFENSAQGRVNCSVPETVEVTVEMPFSSQDETFQIIRASLLSNFSLPPQVELDLSGQTVQAGDTAKTSVSVYLNPALSFASFSGDVLITALAPSGLSCEAKGKVSFDVAERYFGRATCPPIDPPFGFPTISPSLTPTVGVGGTTRLPLVELISRTPELQQLEAFLTFGDILGFISGTGPFTIMMPWNRAFEDLETDLAAKLRKREWNLHLQSLLKYHIYEGEIVVDDQVESHVLKMANGEDSVITRSPERDRVWVNDVFVFSRYNATVRILEHMTKSLPFLSLTHHSLICSTERKCFLVGTCFKTKLDQLYSEHGCFWFRYPINIYLPFCGGRLGVFAIEWHFNRVCTQ